MQSGQGPKCKNSRRKGKKKTLTTRGILRIEYLPCNDASKVAPPVDSQHDGSGSSPWRVCRQPCRHERTAHKDSGHAHVGKSVAKLLLLERCRGHDDAADEANCHTADDVERALAEMVARPDYDQQANDASAQVSTDEPGRAGGDKRRFSRDERWYSHQGGRVATVAHSWRST